MTFTDDDLRRLNEEKSRSFTWRHFKIPVLLARLEAAEVVCKLCDDHEFNPCPGVSEGLKAWRKVASK